MRMSLETMNAIVNSGLLGFLAGLLAVASLPLLLFGFRMSGGPFKKPIQSLEAARVVLVLSMFLLTIHSAFLLVNIRGSQILSGVIYLVLVWVMAVLVAVVSQKIAYTRLSFKVYSEKGEPAVFYPDEESLPEDVFPIEMKKSKRKRKVESFKKVSKIQEGKKGSGSSRVSEDSVFGKISGNFKNVVERFRNRG